MRASSAACVATGRESASRSSPSLLSNRSRCGRRHNPWYRPHVAAGLEASLCRGTKPGTQHLAPGAHKMLVGRPLVPLSSATECTGRSTPISHRCSGPTNNGRPLNRTPHASNPFAKGGVPRPPAGRPAARGQLGGPGVGGGRGANLHGVATVIYDPVLAALLLRGGYPLPRPGDLPPVANRAGPGWGGEGDRGTAADLHGVATIIYDSVLAALLLRGGYPLPPPGDLPLVANRAGLGWGGEGDRGTAADLHGVATIIYDRWAVYFATEPRALAFQRRAKSTMFAWAQELRHVGRAALLYAEQSRVDALARHLAHLIAARKPSAALRGTQYRQSAWPKSSSSYGPPYAPSIGPLRLGLVGPTNQSLASKFGVPSACSAPVRSETDFAILTLAVFNVNHGLRAGKAANTRKVDIS